VSFSLLNIGISNRAFKKIKIFFILTLLFNSITAFAQIGDYPYTTINSINQTSSLVHITMYHNNVAYALGQAYWITIQNLTQKHIHVKGTYFADLLCGNRASATIDVDIDPSATTGPAKGYLVDATGLQAKAERDLCDIKPLYDASGNKIWKNIISSVGYQLTQVKVDDEVSQNANNSSNVRTTYDSISQKNKITSANTYDPNRKNVIGNNSSTTANNQKRQQQLQLLDQINTERANANTSFQARINNLLEGMETNTIQQNIDKNTTEREDAFNTLRELLQNKNGHLVDCSSCDGQGTYKCNYCGGSGYKICISCFGSGQVSCSACGGTGTSLGKTCVICGGKGHTKCSNCFGKGKLICYFCNGSGNIQCDQCHGTGREFVEDSNTETTEYVKNNVTANSNYTVSNPGTDNPATISSGLMTVNKVAPDFKINSITGVPIQLSTYRGKKLLLIFWSSSNDESITEYKKLSQSVTLIQAKGYNVVGIGMEFSRYQWQTAITENNLTGIQLSEFQGNDSNTSQSFEVSRLPCLFIIDAKGFIKTKSNTFTDLESFIN
jgi:peroxiredoxin